MLFSENLAVSSMLNHVNW